MNINVAIFRLVLECCTLTSPVALGDNDPCNDYANILEVECRETGDERVCFLADGGCYLEIDAIK